MDHHSVAGTTVVGGNLFGPSERRVACDRPSSGVVRISRRTTKLVVMLEDVLDGLMHSVEVGHLIEEPAHTAFSTRPVVPDDVKDQSVIELTGCLDGVDQPADLGVGILAKPSEDLHLAGKQLLFIRTQCCPVLNSLGIVCELG